MTLIDCGVSAIGASPIPPTEARSVAGAAPRPEANGVSYLRTPFNRPLVELIGAADKRSEGEQP